MERMRRLDPKGYNREYGAEFGEGDDAFIPGELLDRVVVKGRKELPPKAGVTYYAGGDPNLGGSDAWTLCIGHLEHGSAVVDLIAPG
jgi:hypothetical protein